MSSFGFVLVLITAGMTMAANLILRAGIDAAGGFEPRLGKELLFAVMNLFLQPLFAIGFVMYFLASLIWFRVVATEPLSVAYPILVSTTFGLVTAGAVVFFHESLTIQKVAGLAIILAGIAIISFEKGL